MRKTKKRVTAATKLQALARGKRTRSQRIDLFPLHFPMHSPMHSPTQ